MTWGSSIKWTPGGIQMGHFSAQLRYAKCRQLLPRKVKSCVRSSLGSPSLFQQVNHLSKWSIFHNTLLVYWRVNECIFSRFLFSTLNLLFQGSKPWKLGSSTYWWCNTRRIKRVLALFAGHLFLNMYSSCSNICHHIHHRMPVGCIWNPRVAVGHWAGDHLPGGCHCFAAWKPHKLRVDP